MALVIDRRVGLGDDVGFLAVGGEVIDLVGDAAVLDLAIRRFEEAEFVDAREGRQRRDQTDVRAFRRFHRADAAVVRRMNVADFEAGAVAGQTARPEGGEAALVGQLGQRIDLVHELRELAAAEEIADDGGQRLRVDELLRRHAFDALIEQRHALLDEALGAGQADAALVGEQFADGADAAAAEMIDVVQAAFALFQAQEILGGGDQIFLGQDAGIAALDAELLVDLVTADAAEVVALRIEEQPLDERAGVGGGRRIAGAQAAVDVLEGLLLVLGGILLHALDDDPLVHGGVHDADLVDAEFGDLLDDRLGQRLEGAGDHDALVGVDGVLDQHLVLEVVELLGLLDASGPRCRRTA